MVGHQICLLYFAESESERGKYVTPMSEECAFERWTCCLGCFSLALLGFFWLRRFNGASFAAKAMLLIVLVEGPVVGSPFTGCLHPFKASEVESVKFYKAAAVGLCRRAPLCQSAGVREIECCAFKGRNG